MKLQKHKHCSRRIVRVAVYLSIAVPAQLLIDEHAAVEWSISGVYGKLAVDSEMLKITVLQNVGKVLREGNFVIGSLSPTLSVMVG